MIRLMRQVDIASWAISGAMGERAERLHRVPEPSILIDLVLSEACSAAKYGKVQIRWQDSSDSPGYGRIHARIPLSEQTFDQLINGRSGYRAQYYLSPEEGILFNRDIVTGLLSAVEEVYRTVPIEASISVIRKSLTAPHSKIWVFDEIPVFDDARDDMLNPPRWVSNKATRGRKAPLPSHFTIDLKGAFINPQTDQIFVDDLKLDRARDLFNKGYT
jgi:hypothetical protein